MNFKQVGKNQEIVYDFDKNGEPVILRPTVRGRFNNNDRYVVCIHQFGYEDRTEWHVVVAPAHFNQFTVRGIHQFKYFELIASDYNPPYTFSSLPSRPPELPTTFHNFGVVAFGEPRPHKHVGYFP